jgi:hypothetical protein
MVIVAACGGRVDSSGPAPSIDDGTIGTLGENELAPRGFHWTRDEAGGHGGGSSSGGGGSSPNMTYHGGKIMTTYNVTPIFWGKSWVEGDIKMTGIDDFYAGFNGSN